MQNATQSQKEAVKAYLLKGNTITQLEALYHFDCLRLSHIIYLLRNEGLDIDMQLVSNAKKNKKFGRYQIKAE